MLEEKFSIPALEQERKEIDETFGMVTELLHGIGIEKIDKIDVEPVVAAFDYILRACGMYNDIMQQVLEKEGISTADPQSYVESKINAAYNLVKIIHDKYKHLSRWGK